ncbi:hypothetical protein L1049_019690 [Liquidambar formosana]|uniref:Uncharacterized protein n=1 Tax=Liquidambar formosana TaxID=63359 RepID=A0AAP0S6I7_LIQFO
MAYSVAIPFGFNTCDCDYYVYNPTTRKYTTFPNLHDSASSVVLGVNLAFDPSKSPHCKVVCVWVLTNGLIIRSWIWISRLRFIRLGRVFGGSLGGFSQLKASILIKGIFWNGAIHWISRRIALCFDVDLEQLREMPMPPMPDGLFEGTIRYFGESRGNLHLVGICDLRTLRFNIYEIFAILCLIRGETDEESFLVLHMSGKAIRYNLIDKTYNKICDVEGSLGFTYPNAYQYIESFSSV